MLEFKSSEKSLYTKGKYAYSGKYEGIDMLTSPYRSFIHIELGHGMKLVLTGMLKEYIIIKELSEDTYLIMGEGIIDDDFDKAFGSFLIEI